MSEAPATSRPLVIGVGSDDRSDDGVGLDVARALRERPQLGADVIEGPGDLTRLLDAWDGRTFVVLVDAVRSGAAPGTIRRWERDEASQLPSETAVSTHGFSLPDVLQLARDLHRLPARLVVFGIEAQETGPGNVRSPPVRAAVETACHWIASELTVGPRGVPRGPGGARTNA